MSKMKFGLVLVAAGMLTAVGCAKKEVTKPDEQAAAQQQGAGQQAQKGPQATMQQPGQQPAQQGGAQPGAPVEQPIKETPAVKEEQRINVAQAPEVKLETIYFDFDSYVLTEDARTKLAVNAEQLKKNPNVKIQIEGHCDERGSDEYNLALGEKRARAVYSYLITMGIPAERLSVISFGKEKPADTGHDDAAWARNRRAELVLQK